MHNQTEAKGERLRDKFVEVLKNGAFLKLTNNPFAYKLNKNLVTFLISLSVRFHSMKLLQIDHVLQLCFYSR